MTKYICVNKKTSETTEATVLENGKISVDGKEYAQSTFKRYYKVVEEIVEAAKEEEEELTELAEAEEVGNDFGEPKEMAEEPAKDNKFVEVVLQAFTGMKLGVYTACVNSVEKTCTVATKKGNLLFDMLTMKQLDCKNPKFANKIVFA